MTEYPVAFLANKSGLAYSAVKAFAKNPTKSKTALQLVNRGLFTLDEYQELPDGSKAFYNNMFFAKVCHNHNMVNFNFLNMTAPTIAKLAKGTAGRHTTKTLLFMLEKMGYDTKEYYESFNHQESQERQRTSSLEH